MLRGLPARWRVAAPSCRFCLPACCIEPDGKDGKDGKDQGLGDTHDGTTPATTTKKEHSFETTPPPFPWLKITLEAKKSQGKEGH